MAAIRAGVLYAALALCAAAAQAQQDGATVFKNACAACHNAAGQGNAGLAPALAGVLAPLAQNDDGRRYMIQVLLSGLSGKIVSQGQVFTGAMPAQATLDDEQIAAVATFVLKDLNGAQVAPFTAPEVAKSRGVKHTHKELRELRERLLK